MSTGGKREGSLGYRLTFRGAISGPLLFPGAPFIDLCGCHHDRELGSRARKEKMGFLGTRGGRQK